MKLCVTGSMLQVSAIEQLGAASSAIFQEELNSALTSAIQTVEFDLSETRFADCCGLGALLSMRSLAAARQPGMTFRVSNPPAKVARLLQLTKLDAFLPGTSRTTEDARMVGPELQARFLGQGGMQPDSTVPAPSPTSDGKRTPTIVGRPPAQASATELGFVE